MLLACRGRAAGRGPFKKKHGFHFMDPPIFFWKPGPLRLRSVQIIETKEEIDMSNSYFNVCTPVKGKNYRVRFEQVGVAFPSKDGAKSVMTIKLNSLPVNGELVIFQPRPSSEEE